MTGASKLLLFFLVFSLALVGIRGDAGGPVDTPEDRSPLRSELDQLRSKIAALESNIAEGNLQLKAKDETLLQFKHVVKEKSEIIASLRAEIESLQEKGANDAAELAGKAHARAAKLEKQIDKLKSDIQAQGRKKDALEARAAEAEKKVEELNLLLVILQKTNDEQKARIKKTELELEKAQEELMNLLFEASSKMKELTEIHGAWLPPWLSAHLGHCQAITEAKWNEHGKPAYEAFLQKVSQISAQVQKKVDPHWEAAKKKWIPTMKEHWMTVRTSAQPYARLVTTKTVEFYETSVTTLKPHIVRVQDIAHPYFQEAKNFSKCYIDQVMTVMKPHVEKAQTVLKPYTEQVAYAGEKVLGSVTTYHHQVQSVFKQTVKKYKLSNTLARNEFVWFAASAFLVLPIFLVYSLFASIVGHKPRRSTQKTHANRASQKHKHRHAGK